MKQILKNTKWTTFICCLFISIAMYAQTPGDKICGEWVNEQMDKKITFDKVGDGSYTAKLSWKKTSDGPVVGTTIVKKLIFKDGKYSGGQLFTPKSGWINGKALVNDKGELELTGSKSFFSKTQIWTRP